MTSDDGRPADDGVAEARGAWPGDLTRDAAGGPWSEPGPPGGAEPEPEPEPAPAAEAEAGPEPDEREPGRGSAPGPGPEPEPDAEPEPLLDPGGRTIPLRLARLHLRMGSLALARAELESYAGVGLLDEPALLDLAEARWRTGDLAGAGEAANAALSRGIEDPLAYAIAAEATAAIGRPVEARRLAGHALEGLGTTLDVLFAGMPRSLIWPGEPEPEAAAPGAGRRDDPDRTPASAAAAESFAGGRAALAASDIPTAALRLSLAIRLDPNFAQGVLTAIGERASLPHLALVAGDALRLLGRDPEALEAYDRARGKAAPPLALVPEPGPGDDDDAAAGA